VKHPGQLCGGHIGRNGKGCLKSTGECDVESHKHSKCEFLNDPFLVLKEGKDQSERGYEGVTLQTNGLDHTLVLALLDKTDVNWATELEQI
jgi:hypothetical protein